MDRYIVVVVGRGNKMELSDVGTQCHLGECRALDFLPYKCDVCGVSRSVCVCVFLGLVLLLFAKSQSVLTHSDLSTDKNSSLFVAIIVESRMDASH